MTSIVEKREEFRKYLERCGLLDALTRALVSLYDELQKPEDALEFMRTALGDNRPPLSEILVMREDLATAKLRIEELEEEVKILRGETIPGEGEGDDEEPNFPDN